MRCPDCNKKQRSKELLKLGHCKRCGRKHKISDFIKSNAFCPLFDVCNYADECDDSDWEHCGTYVCFKKVFGNRQPSTKEIKMEPIVEDFPALKPFRLKSGITGEMEMIK